MDPMHIHALLQLQRMEDRRHQLEQYFVTRDEARTARRERIRRLRRRFVDRGASRPKSVGLAVR